MSEIIECSVCLERMDTKSKVLPCQHTFCSDCLDQIATQSKVGVDHLLLANGRSKFYKIHYIYKHSHNLLNLTVPGSWC